MTSPSRSRWLGPPAELPAKRVASLVPSLTEAVFELGVGQRLVARTDWCVSPAAGVSEVETIGGTKNPDVARLLELRPGLVLANREENTRRRVLALAEELPVWLTDPRAPADVPALWRELGEITGSAVAEDHAAAVEKVLAEVRAAAAGRPSPPFVYWVWREPWIAAGHDTYISRVLEAAGLRNALPPPAQRFPKVEPQSALGAPVHLFASEPFAFSLPGDLAVWGGGEQIEEGWYRLASGGLALPVDGQLFGWYPVHTAAALRHAAVLRRRLVSALGL